MSKNYLNPKNILAEGFFNKLFKFLRATPATQAKIKQDKRIKQSLKSLNNSQAELEDALGDLLGKEINLSRFNFKDFF